MSALKSRFAVAAGMVTVITVCHIGFQYFAGVAPELVASSHSCLNFEAGSVDWRTVITQFISSAVLLLFFTLAIHFSEKTSD